MYDVIVIGGGPGGYAAAIRASQLKGKVAIVEAKAMGGTCVLRGCIPSKVWMHAGALLETARKAGDFGLKLTVGELDFDAVVARKKGVSNDIAMGMAALLQNNGVEVVNGRGRLVAPGKVDVDGNILEAKSVIVATGSQLKKCDVPGADAIVMTTDQLLEMDAAPASVLITDPSYIGVEMAMLLSVFGSKVTMALPGPRILPDEDQDTSQRLAQSLRERGVKIMARYSLEKVDGKKCTLKGSSKEAEVEVERVIVSARMPVAKDLGLEALGVKFKEDGGIDVDARCMTACPGVYAIGDCTGGWMLSHVASAMGICAAENCMGKKATFNAGIVSRALWGMPEMGSIGLSEEQAERGGHEVEIGGFPYSINGLAMLRGEVDGAVKVVADADTGEILGVHIVGAQASELIGEAALAMQLECTVEEFAKGFRVHPSFSETVVDGFRDADGWALYLPKRG